MMKSRTAAILLAVSAALNFAFIGYWLGQESKPDPAFDPARGYQHWARTLTPERRKAVRPILRSERQAQRTNFRELRKLNRRLRHAIATEPFDAQELHAVLAGLRRGHGEVQALSHDAFVRFVEALSQEERRALVKDLGRFAPVRGPHPRGDRLHQP